MDNSINISDLIKDISVTSSRAILSLLGQRSPALRKYLEAQYTQSPGMAGALLASPVLEATFGWKTAGVNMESLTEDGLLSQDLLLSMDNPPEDYRDEYMFPRDREPFRHQLESWRFLLDKKPRSVLVTSGTGSGKTECFLVPILEDLIRECSVHGKLSGVRALFLYPLNALINSQRDRLHAWCDNFNNDIRFCLYNGETQDRVPSHEQKKAGAEQISRQSLREDPAPILVTNSTMLEYMLTRREDRPILDQSRGKLKWIVLDEAHTYIGSQAAEIALLLRRVLHNFAVSANEVRFIATSATLGDERATEELEKFLADVSGVSLDRIHVVAGARHVPALPRLDNRLSREIDEDLNPEELYNVLCHHPQARKLRSCLVRQAMALNDLQKELAMASDEIVTLLQQGSIARRNKEAFLPLRMHLFHRTQQGLWACVNSSCTGRVGALSDDTWKFGAVYTERRTHCGQCGYPVFELVECGDCGQHYLSALESFSAEDNVWMLIPPVEKIELDEFELEIDPVDQDEQSVVLPPSKENCLICSHGDELDQIDDVREYMIGKDSHIAKEGNGVLIHVYYTSSKKEKARCIYCGTQGSRTNQIRELRIGSPFALSAIVPTILEYMPPSILQKKLPSDGRRLLGFTDSRQRSARLAVRLQQEAERNWVRSTLYHALIAKRNENSMDSKKLRELEQQIKDLQAANRPSFKSIIEKNKAELARAKEPNKFGTLSWEDAIKCLDSSTDMRLMHSSFQSTTGIGIDPQEFANFCLYREFVRRPKRMNSMETMGMVSLQYPFLEDKTPPSGWPQSLDPNDWQKFLKLMIDFYIRSNAAVDIKDDYLNWLGGPIRKTYIQGPNYSGNGMKNIQRWPSGKRMRIIRLLLQAAKLDGGSSEDTDLVSHIFLQAWQALRQAFEELPDGYLFKLRDFAHLSELSLGAVCPYTGRVLDTTLAGLSPYLPQINKNEICEFFDPPKVQKAYWRDELGEHASKLEIMEWLENDQNVAKARKLGVWSNLNDRVAAVSSYFAVAEHSAQLNGSRLRELEKQFKEGRLNVLSCSTTMEMGVDIGGLSAIIMNNAPPNASNYLQRAGRAGRRGEGISLAVTLCSSTPHGEQVFSNPLWPFDSRISVPWVALDSERLVQRHVNSLCLSSFLVSKGGDIRRLRSGWFFVDELPQGENRAHQFTSWCRGEAKKDSTLCRGLEDLIYRTALETHNLKYLFDSCAERMESVAETWYREYDALKNNNDEWIRQGADNKAPAIMANEKQLRRLRDEYLLSDLACRGFLPSYGFPAGIVNFVPVTIADLTNRRRSRNDEDTREDKVGKRLGYPTRQMNIAIREYAPGADVVVDGRVYRSSGLTLNWQYPPDAADTNEIQAIRYAWICKGCGTTGDSVTFLDACQQCGEGPLEFRKYIEPAGFAVDIGYRPHNNVVSPTYIPVEQPLISCPSDDWKQIPAPSKGQYVGRFRYSDSGHLFHGSRGASRHGYAVCLRCGRAASESGDPTETEIPDDLVEGHARLRGGKDASGRSICNGQGFSIQRGLTLGSSEETDIFELQLAGLVEDDIAWSIGVALQLAFMRRIGVEADEIGVTIRQSRDAASLLQQSIFLYDTSTGGNGYVAALRSHIAPALGEVPDVLDCVNHCDAACHGCLLTYHTQHDSNKLDRRKALDFLRAR